MKSNKIVAIMIFAFMISNLKGQSLSGTRGLINAPSARMYEDGTLSVGLGYVPSEFFIRTSGPNYGLRSGNAGLNTFISVNPLPFMEIMFRYSHEFNQVISPATKYFPDRMFTFRFKLLEESKKIPALVLGLQDISGALNLSSSGANYYTSTYFVVSKKIEFRKLLFDMSLGYGFKFLNVFPKNYDGYFGGIEIKHTKFDKTQLLIEYDTKSFNLGIQSYLFNRIHTIFGVMNFKPMYIIAYRYKI